jgi:hypothetical protein
MRRFRAIGANNLTPFRIESKALSNIFLYAYQHKKRRRDASGNAPRIGKYPSARRLVLLWCGD